MEAMDPRRKKLTDLAEYVAGIFRTKNFTRLEDIAGMEGLQVSYDNYERAFDGMLVLDDDYWHIHIDIDSGNEKGSRKARFTLAHELAHYIIEEHKKGIADGTFLHGSKFDLDPSDPREQDADYFAANLLMPQQLFRAVKKPRTFNIDTIFQLSEEFQTSFISTVQRFCDIGTHSVCVVYAQNNRVKWFRKSKDFPDWAFRFKIGQPLPPTTVAGEFYGTTPHQYSSPEEMDPAIWFYPKWSLKNKMREQCYYSHSYQYVISLIWFE
jgi:Zn-dependent peptidase ImmA (M78 family)